MTTPVIVTIPLWLCVVVVVWLACVLALIGMLNMQLRLLYELWKSNSGGTP